LLFIEQFFQHVPNNVFMTEQLKHMLRRSNYLSKVWQMVLPGRISGASCDTEKTGFETQIHSCDRTRNGPEPVTGNEHVNVAT